MQKRDYIVRNLSFLLLEVIVRFGCHWRQPPFFPICLSRHRCEIRRGGCHFLVYHRNQNNGSLIFDFLSALFCFCTFTETSSGSVRPLSIMLVCSLFSLEVSGIGIYWFRHLGYNYSYSYRLNSLPRVPLPGSPARG